MSRALHCLALASALAGCAVAPTPTRVAHPPIGPWPTETASDTGLFGIVLNKPLGGVGECSSDPDILDKKVRRYSSAPPAEKPCYERWADKRLIGSVTPLGTETLFVRWPVRSTPNMLKNDSVGVGLIDGIVHSITVNTHGLSRQSADIRELIAKFGKPSSHEFEQLQNRMGAKYEALSATWVRPGGVTIFYLGAVTRIDQGHLEATTARGAEHKRQQLKALDSPRRQL